jgi:hypothetical protein
VSGNSALFICGCRVCVVKSILVWTSGWLWLPPLVILTPWLKERLWGLLSNYDLLRIPKLFASVLLFTLCKVFCSLWVAATLGGEKVWNVHQLFLIEVLGWTHHRCLLLAAKVGLHMLHVNEVRPLRRVSDSTSCAWTPKRFICSVTYFYMFSPDSVPDLRPELILLITFCPLESLGVVSCWGSWFEGESIAEPILPFFWRYINALFPRLAGPTAEPVCICVADYLTPCGERSPLFW